jgi:murein DD-endopeptidase MepM/ murein hydrolase activator NlpD
MKATPIRKALVLTGAVLSLSVAMTAVVTAQGPSAALAASVVQLPQRGDSGPEVVRLQQAIVARGFTLKGGVTGEYNGQTVAALRSLQKVAGFKATGALDERTAKFLGLVDVAPIAANALPSVGTSGDTVWSLQQALINAGTQVKGGADGKFGLATTIALGKFQSTRGLKVTKVLDEPTAVALGLLPAPAPVKAAPSKQTPAPAPVQNQTAAPAETASITVDTLPVRGQKSEAVRLVQQTLINAGVEVKGGADAVFGVATTIAITKFQESRGLNQSGVLDINTAAALGLIPSLEELGLPSLKVFPMQGRCNFSDTWGQARSGGRSHEGTDVIGPKGLALYAVVDGVIAKTYVGASNGGNAIRLTAPDGTYFYYAHLDSFAPGIAAGVSVRAGQIIGYNGASGNAGTPHLHFEVHPRGGAAVNPYPILKAVDACSVTEVLPQ